MPKIVMLVLLGVLGAPFLVCDAGADDEKVQDEEALDALRAKAMEHYEAGRYEEALQAWDEVAAQRPQDPVAQLALAKVLLKVGTGPSLLRAERVLVVLQKVSAEDPQGNVNRVQVDDGLGAVYLARARRMKDRPQAREKLRAAVAAWKRVLRKVKQHPGALRGLLEAHVALEEDDTAVAYGESYLALCRESQQRWKAQQERWAAVQKNAVTSAQRKLFAEKIENARRKEAEALHVLGTLHLRREQGKQAASRYTAILALDAKDARALLGRARARRILGQSDLAKQDLARCLELATDPGVRAEAKKLLDQHRRAPDPKKDR